MASPSEWVFTVHPASESERCEVCAVIFAEIPVDGGIAAMGASILRTHAVTLCERHTPLIVDRLREIGAVSLAD